MAFRVGQEIVCIDDSQDPLRPHSTWLDGDKPTVGWIYTVIGHDKPNCGRPCIFINGHPNWSFLASRFRPLVTRKTDISALKALLEPAKENA